MENNIQVFSNPEFGVIRAIGTENNPMFCASDLCKALGYSNPRKAVADHVDEGDVTKRDTPTTSGVQSMTFVNESGLYSLIFGSKLDNAKRFKHWVTSEVLPSIRKHGAYMSEQVIERTLSDPDYLIQLATTLKEEKRKRIDTERQLQIAQGENTHLQEQNKMLQPKAQYTDEVLQSTSTYTFTQCAKELDFHSVNAFLHELKRRGIIFKQSGQYQLTSKFAGKGYSETRTARYYHNDGTPGTSTSTVITEKGRMWLHGIFNRPNS